jgi:hypothetical protein
MNDLIGISAEFISDSLELFYRFLLSDTASLFLDTHEHLGIFEKSEGRSGANLFSCEGLSGRWVADVFGARRRRPSRSSLPADAISRVPASSAPKLIVSPLPFCAAR